MNDEVETEKVEQPYVSPYVFGFGHKIAKAGILFHDIETVRVDDLNRT